MKHLRFIIVVMLALGLLISCATTSTESDDENDPIPAVIRITSEPTGVRLEESHTDTIAFTPFEFVIEKPYSYGYYFWLTHPGYFPEEIRSEPDAGDTLEYHIVMESSPDTEILFYQTYYAPGGDTLWRANLDGNIIGPFTGNIISPTYGWSPNHQYFFYYSSDGMVILNPDGSLYSIESIYRRLSWSNSCDRLAYGKRNDGIYIYDIETNQEEKIYDTQGLTYDHNPIFLPGDSLIAFVHHEWGILAWIRIISVNGGTPRTVSDTIWTQHDRALDLTWVSDHEILFRGMSSEYYRIDLYRLDLDTGEATPILETVHEFMVSDDRQSYIVSSSSGLYYGEYGNWTPRLISKELWGMRNLDFSPQDSAIVGTLNGVTWTDLTGKSYRIINNWDHRYISGSCFWH